MPFLPEACSPESHTHPPGGLPHPPGDPPHPWGAQGGDLEEETTAILHSLREFPANPGSRIEHLADAAALRAAGHQVATVKQRRHLCHSEPADGLHADGHVQHLCGNEVAVAGALQPRQLHEDADVPAGQCL